MSYTPYDARGSPSRGCPTEPGLRITRAPGGTGKAPPPESDWCFTQSPTGARTDAYTAGRCVCPTAHTRPGHAAKASRAAAREFTYVSTDVGDP